MRGSRSSLAAVSRPAQVGRPKSGVRRRDAQGRDGNYRTQNGSVYLRYDIVSSQDMRNAAEKMEKCFEGKKSLGTKSGTEAERENRAT